MTKIQNKFNNAKSEVIEENFLKQDPEGLPDTGSIVIAKELPEMRHIQFLNGRDPGCALQFHYASKTHPLHVYTLYHGYEHDLPIEVIDHLEECHENIYGYRKNQYGNIEHFTKSVRYFYQCKPVKPGQRKAI